MPETPANIIMQFKMLEEQLDDNTREQLRSEMLSYLLFRENPTGKTNAFKGLSEEEIVLIKKLAAQTDLLNRLMNDNETDQ